MRAFRQIFGGKLRNLFWEINGRNSDCLVNLKFFGFPPEKKLKLRPWSQPIKIPVTFIRCKKFTNLLIYYYKCNRERKRGLPENLGHSDFRNEFRPKNVSDTADDGDEVEDVPRVFEVILFENQSINQPINLINKSIN